MSNEKEKPMKLMAFAALVVMFLMGAVVGGLGMNAYNKRHMEMVPLGGGPKRPHGPGGKDGGGPGGGPDRFVEHLRTELKLTDDQTKQVKDILSKSHDQFIQVRNEAKAIKEQSQNQIKAVLTPEQQTKLQQLLQDDHDHEGPGPHQH